MTKPQTLEEIRARFAQEEQKKERVNLPNNYYPFWNMKEGEKAIIRFLPDRNTDNQFGFLAQKVMHVLEINGEKKSVPCLSMYGEDCPICKVSQEYYKAEGKDSPNGRKYWKKKQHIAQALVLKDPLPADPTTGETHVGKLRYIALGFQLYQIIQNAFKADDVLDSIPYNLDDGYDFVIAKDKGPKFSTYQLNSKFTKDPRPLNEEELSIAAENMIDLATLLPKHPGKEKVEQMLHAALTGGTLDGVVASANPDDDIDPDMIVPTTTKRVAPKVVVNDEAPFEVVKATPRPTPKADPVEAVVSSDVDEMLATIQARRRTPAK